MADAPETVPTDSASTPVWAKIYVGGDHIFEQASHTLKGYPENWCGQEGVEIFARGRFSKVVIGAHGHEWVKRDRRAFKNYGSNLLLDGPVLIVVTVPVRPAPSTVKPA